MNENIENKAVKAKKGIGRTFSIAMILLLPTLIAVFSFFMIYNDVYISPKNIYEISLYNSKEELIGQEKNYLRNAETDGLIALFSPITDNLSSTTELPERIDKAEIFYADIKYMNSFDRYTFYFFIKSMEGYCSVDGNIYKLSGSDVQKFLVSRFAETMYDTAAVPKMYSISGDEIVPRSVVWNYRSIKGTYNSAQNFIVDNEKNEYDMSGALGLYFDIEPDECFVRIFENSKEVFYGDYNNISSLSFESGATLKLVVEAEWKYVPMSSYYGKQRYEFDAVITDMAEFHLTGDTFAIDAFCGIFCKNVKDASKIRFESVPEFPISPIFALSRENAVALLPILPETGLGEYKITLSYGAATETFTLTIKQRVGGVTLDCNVPYDFAKVALSQASMDQIDQLKGYASDNSKGDKLFYGAFLEYKDMGAEQYSYLGDLYLNDYQNYYCQGHEYRFIQAGGVRVGALNGGTVIKTGYNDYLGNYVIVSHGCGLATWYAHLSTVDVNVGDFVIKNEPIGKTGISGLSSVENVLILATLGDEFTNPSYLCGKQFD